MDRADKDGADTAAVSAFKAELAALCDAPLYRQYLDIRDWVLRRRAEGGADGTPSAYWREELAGFDYMLDASPLIVTKLRHHSYHMTGLRVYDYRSGKEALIPGFAAKMAMLEAVAGDRALLVPEARALGGFGFEIDGALVNIDTLKFWESMIALDKAAVLEGLRAPAPEGDRRVVWEIGAGWGGFARAFKTLVPDCCYVIMDLPESMLFSALYLRHLFPDARMHFHEPGGPAPDWSADFVFLAHTDQEALRPPRLDLAVNMVSFQEMTAAQVRGYVEAAWRRGAPYFYSLNRERSTYNTEIDSVDAILAERFWPHEIPILDLPYTRLPRPDDTHRTVKARDAGRKSEKKKKKDKTGSGEEAPGERAIRGYSHIVGWRKSEP